MKWRRKRLFYVRGETPKSIHCKSQGAPGIPRLMLTCFQPKQNVNIPKIIKTFDRFSPHTGSSYARLPAWMVWKGRMWMLYTAELYMCWIFKAQLRKIETSPTKNSHYASLRGEAACGRCPQSIIHTYDFSKTSSISKPACRKWPLVLYSFAPTTSIHHPRKASKP